jgi:hypothetical protein
MAKPKRVELQNPPEERVEADRYDPWEEKFRSHYRPDSTDRANKDTKTDRAA